MRITAFDEARDHLLSDAAPRTDQRLAARRQELLQAGPAEAQRTNDTRYAHALNAFGSATTDSSELAATHGIRSWGNEALRKTWRTDIDPQIEKLDLRPPDREQRRLTVDTERPDRLGKAARDAFDRCSPGTIIEVQARCLADERLDHGANAQTALLDSRYSPDYSSKVMTRATRTMLPKDNAQGSSRARGDSRGFRGAGVWKQAMQAEA